VKADGAASQLGDDGVLAHTALTNEEDVERLGAVQAI
jgi:hypothetical protein